MNDDNEKSLLQQLITHSYYFSIISFVSVYVAKVASYNGLKFVDDIDPQSDCVPIGSSFVRDFKRIYIGRCVIMSWLRVEQE